MVWPFSSGEILTATNLNAVTIPWNAICIVSKAKSLTDVTLTTYDYDGADLLDPLNWHNIVTNNDRVIPNIAGWYEVTVAGYVPTPTDTFNRLLLQPTKNGTAIEPGDFDQRLESSAGLNSANAATATAHTSMNGTTDYFTATAYQDSGGARTIALRMVVRLIYKT